MVGPAGAVETGLLLAKAEGAEQVAAIGRRAVVASCSSQTEDFWRDHAASVARGVRFLGEPRDERHGRVAVFKDLYRNRWDLIEQ